MAILPPPRRHDRPTDDAPAEVFGPSPETVVAAPPAPFAAAEAAVRARLDEIRLAAQVDARRRHLAVPSDSEVAVAATGLHPAPPVAPPPPPPVARVLPPPPPIAAPDDRPRTNGHADNGYAGNGHGPNGQVANGHGPDPGGPSLFGGATVVADPTVEIDLRGARPGGDTQQPGTLIAENVSAWFGSKKILERISLPMRAGRVTAIIGPSGCGKSVFLRNLNRMHEVIPTAKMAGQISLDGVDIHGDKMSPTEVRLRIGMVFQRPNPFPAMSIGENVLAGLKLSGTKRNDRDDLVEWCLRRAGLWTEVKDRLDSGGSTLSGGQQQRLCIARALALRPKVLLMDEPCSALDPISTRVIEETILEIAHEITVVIVTHNMQQAQRVADDCAFFLIERIGDPGRVVEWGPTDDIFNRPRDPRTGDYVSGRFG